MIDDLRALDLNVTTPLEALQLLQQWKSRLETEKKNR